MPGLPARIASGPVEKYQSWPRATRKQLNLGSANSDRRFIAALRRSHLPVPSLLIFYVHKSMALGMSMLSGHLDIDLYS